MPAAANIPINQQDALPLQTIEGAIGGEVTLIGSTISRKWDPSRTGINGTATTTNAGGLVHIASSYFDVSGCRSFTAMFTRVSATIGLGATPACRLFMQMRKNSTDVPGASYDVAGSPSIEFAGGTIVGGNTITWPAILAPPDEQRALVCWDFADLLNVGAPPGAGGVGSMYGDTRLILSWSTNPVNAANRFSLFLWGSS